MTTLTVKTSGQGLYEVTADIGSWLSEQTVGQGLLTIFIQHTSASLIIQENSDPTAMQDLENFFQKLVPEDGSYLHSAEGPDDMPAHIKSALTATSIGIPIIDGELGLGVWQGVYVFEHRKAPQTRRLICMLSPSV